MRGVVPDRGDSKQKLARVGMGWLAGSNLRKDTDWSFVTEGVDICVHLLGYKGYLQFREKKNTVANNFPSISVGNPYPLSLSLAIPLTLEGSAPLLIKSGFFRHTRSNRFRFLVVLCIPWLLPP